ncbi:MAG: thioredoxin family protein [bacterium]
MLARMLLLVGAMLASVVAYQLFLRLHRLSLNRSSRAKNLPYKSGFSLNENIEDSQCMFRSTGESLFEENREKHERPTLLYFSGENCAACHSQQTPAIAHLREELGDRFDLVHIDALKQRQLASQWQVWTLPTTIVLNRNGEVQCVNHGATPATRLRKQILSSE